MIAIALAAFAAAAPAAVVVSRETTYLTAPLDADGMVDYAAALDAQYGRGVTPENNAVVLLADVLGGVGDEARARLGAARGPKALAPQGLTQILPLTGPVTFADLLALQEKKPRPDVERTLRQQLEAARQTPWRSLEYPWLAEWLRANEGPLARVAEAVRRPRFWVPVVKLTLDFPSGLRYREACNALAARAMLHAGAGDAAAARGDVLTCFRLASLYNQDPWLVSRLVAAMLRSIATEAAIGLAASTSLVPRDARALLSALDGLTPPATPLEAVSESERYLSLSAWIVRARRVTADPKAWPGEWRQIAGTAGVLELAATVPPVLDWNEGLRALNRCFDQQAARGSEASIGPAGAERYSPSDVAPLLARSAGDAGANRELSRAVAALGCPALGRSIVSHNEAEARFRLARLLVATVAWRAEKGSLPLRPEDLSPAYLPAAATREVDAGYRISFSRGADGAAFAFVAIPEHPGRDGVTRFCVDAGARLLPMGDEAAAIAGRCPGGP